MVRGDSSKVGIIRNIPVEVGVKVVHIWGPVAGNTVILSGTTASKIKSKQQICFKSSVTKLRKQ